MNLRKPKLSTSRDKYRNSSNNRTNEAALLCKQSALSRSLHFSWHFTPHSVHRTPCRAIPQSKPAKEINLIFLFKSKLDYFTFALVTISWRCCVVRRKIVRGRRRNRIDQGLKGFLVHMCFLERHCVRLSSQRKLLHLLFSPDPRR